MIALLSVRALRGLIVTISVTLMAPFAHAVLGGTDSGGGAGCIGPDGKMATLYYCGAYLGTRPTQVVPPPKPLSIDGPSQTPSEVKELLQYVSKQTYLSPETRETLIRAIQPSFKRKYFSTLSPPELTAPLVARIKEEFHRATGLDSQNLSLYAVTDTQAHVSNYDGKAQVTYLLPAFFALPTLEQKMVALFHESLWVFQPDADYSTIVAQEIAFEAVIARPGRPAREFDFLKKIQGEKVTTGLVSLAIQSDLQTGALDGFVSKQGELSSLKLIGLSNIKCFNKTINMATAKAKSDDTTVGPELKDLSDQCVTDYENYLDGLRRSFPRSIFLAVVGSSESKELLDRVRISTGSDIYPNTILRSLNYFICYIAGRGDYERITTCGVEIDPTEAKGTVNLLLALEKSQPNGWLDRTLETIKESAVMIRLQSSAEGAKNGALTPVHAPEITNKDEEIEDWYKRKTERKTCFLGFCR